MLLKKKKTVKLIYSGPSFLFFLHQFPLQGKYAFMCMNISGKLVIVILFYEILQ